MKKKRNKKPKDWRWHVKKLDDVFSKWIRERDGHKCFTCQKQMTYRESQAGHYISRSNMSLRWSTVNVHCQCYGCNVCKNGNMDVYALQLIAYYQDPDILHELAIEKHKTKKWTIPEMKELIEVYSKKT